VWVRSGEYMARRGFRASNMVDLFSGHQVAVQEATIDDVIDEQKALASADLMAMLALNGPLRFSGVVARLPQTYILRETNVKDICVDLAKAGAIENTWGSGNRKPHDDSMIKLNNTTG